MAFDISQALTVNLWKLKLKIKSDKINQHGFVLEEKYFQSDLKSVRDFHRVTSRAELYHTPNVAFSYKKYAISLGI